MSSQIKLLQANDRHYYGLAVSNILLLCNACETILLQLVKGFDHGKNVYAENMQISSLPDDTKQRNLKMDEVPRTWRITYDMRYASQDLVEPLREFKKLDSDLFDFIDPYSIRGEAETTLLTVSMNGKLSPFITSIKFYILVAW